MKILVDYDKATGSITFEDNYELHGGMIGQDYKEASASGNIDTLVKLKNAGFTVDEIVELNRKELL